MRFPVEIMLRGDQRVFTETADYPEAAATWTASDVSAVLKLVLLAIVRVQEPGRVDVPPVSLRGMSWIAHAAGDGAVMALEIHSASAVAGPFDIDAARLESLMRSAVASESAGASVH